ncbi:MAG: dimethylhistidine N-methyltransferase [Bacteroidetes bacterium 46-16]|nr:MAG: dimethylhistidine N-methyltransferase [Bacteroidetes bacterium 46-16]
MNRFYKDVVRGLSADAKYLDSKYFYDKEGDKLFTEIMACPEYYPTRCEMEIFSQQSTAISRLFKQYGEELELVELGAGDATKSIHLLRSLVEDRVNFTYYPIDISSNVIKQLEDKLPLALPGLQVKGLNGEYFEMLKQLGNTPGKRKVVLFLGSNIGNIPSDGVNAFCKELRRYLNKGDLAFIGFDLKKDPRTILAAYNDKGGITRRFNLNLLHRINNELGADFDLSGFEHYPVYDPGTGTCKSYLVSLAEQRVCVGDTECFDFKEGEPIHTEISQKYAVAQTDELAAATGFKPVKHLFDSRHWFLDAVWECV